MHDVITMITYFGNFSKKKEFFFVPLQIGQLIVFKGMLIGIYKSPDLFDRNFFKEFYSISNPTEDRRQRVHGK
jgi:hypothetical protein